MVSNHRKPPKPNIKIKVHAIRREEPDFHLLARALVDLAEEELKKEDVAKSRGPKETKNSRSRR